MVGEIIISKTSEYSSPIVKKEKRKKGKTDQYN